ncbi:MAG: helix-turn-helix domain-containing protein [Lachnospiraceae bacterium]
MTESSIKERKQCLNKELGLRIKTARNNAKLTQEQLSERLNVNTQFISDLERGICGPSLITLHDLSEILGVSTDYLIKGTSSQEEKDSNPYTLKIGRRKYTLSEQEFTLMEQTVDTMLCAFKLKH